jgi:hypothetical protein
MMFLGLDATGQRLGRTVLPWNRKSSAQRQPGNALASALEQLYPLPSPQQ